MKIEYNSDDGIVHMTLSNATVTREVSYGWHINLAFGDDELVEITILEAKASGYWPPEKAMDLMAALDTKASRASRATRESVAKRGTC